MDGVLLYSKAKLELGHRIIMADELLILWAAATFSIGASLLAKTLLLKVLETKKFIQFCSGPWSKPIWFGVFACLWFVYTVHHPRILVDLFVGCFVGWSMYGMSCIQILWKKRAMRQAKSSETEPHSAC